MALLESQMPVTTIAETGEQVHSAGANKVMTLGTLSGGGLFTVQLEGGQVHRTGLQHYRHDGRTADHQRLLDPRLLGWQA